MKFSGWKPQTIDAVTAGQSLAFFAGNVHAEISQSRETRNGWRVSAVLRCKSSRGPGARRSHSGRRTVAATWEAHRKVMAALFDLNPNGRIQSMLADYNGRAEFLAKFEATAGHNAGSMCRPVAFGDL